MIQRSLAILAADVRMDLLRGTGDLNLQRVLIEAAQFERSVAHLRHRRSPPAWAMGRSGALLGVLFALGFVVCLILGLALLRRGSTAAVIGMTLCVGYLVGGGVVWIANGPHRADIV